MSGILDGVVGGLQAVATGLSVTARYAVGNWTRNGAVTVQYPDEQPKLPARFRGHLYNVAPDCIVCNLCAKACPVDCFVIEGEPKPDGKKRAAIFDIDLTKCIYCGLCTRACPTGSLTFQPDFQVAPERHAGAKDHRYLFRVSAGQMELRLSTVEMARLRAMGRKPRSELSLEDCALLDRIESPQGTQLLGRYGYGIYTPEERAEVERQIAEAKAKKAAAAPAAKKEGA